MAVVQANVALLTERRYTASEAAEGDWYLANILRDDALLQAALLARGLSSTRVNWADPSVDWTQFQCAVFRTTWDYFDQRDVFCEWLDAVSNKTRLCNDVSLIHWNMDKHYLRDLEINEIPVIPSVFVEQGSQISLHDVLADHGWNEAIIKPCISGGARHTYRLNRASIATVEPIINALISEESFLLQPFQSSVLEDGEDTLMLFNGVVTHAVRKKPKAGDFRVQDDHGGSVETFTPTAAHIDLAERAMAACHIAPHYGRVDMVRDNEGNLAVMELELIEPELWLRNHPSAATLFAGAIEAMIGQ